MRGRIHSWFTWRNKKEMIIFNYNGHFRNVGTGTIFSKIVYFTNQQKINYPNSFHIDSDGGNIEKFHHLGGDEIKL